MNEVVESYELTDNDTLIDINNLINPAFDEIWETEKPNVALKGGRGSTKSSVVSLRLVTEFLEDEDANAVIFRKVANTLEMSVYEQIKWAIGELNVYDQFTFRKSPYRIIHKETNTAFYFYGVDDPLKLKSQKISKGYVR